MPGAYRSAGPSGEVVVERHVAESDGADEALVAQRRHGVELCCERHVAAGVRLPLRHRLRRHSNA